MSLDALRRALEPAIRRVLHFYWRFARGLTLGVRAVVIDRAGRVFLVKHSYVAGWHLPGGGVETGETVREALARELLEEGGISALGSPGAARHLLQRAGLAPRPCGGVRGARFHRKGGPRHPREIIDHGFFAPDALPEETTRGTRARLAEVLDGCAALASGGDERLPLRAD